MSILSKDARKNLVECVRAALADSVVSNPTLTEGAIIDGINFVNEGATYEQMLNLAFNPNRDTNYIASHVLEQAVAVLSTATELVQEGAIGVREIAKASIKLEKAGNVICESALDAALAASQCDLSMSILVSEGKSPKAKTDAGIKKITKATNDLLAGKKASMKGKTPVAQGDKKVLASIKDAGVKGGNLKKVAAALIGAAAAGGAAYAGKKWYDKKKKA